MFESAQKYPFFGFVLAFYRIRAVTILTMADYGPPQLHKTKNGRLKKMVQRGIGAINWDLGN